jgi:hypothetical protein
MNLTNKKVKIIIEKFTDRKNELSQKFINFVENNQYKIFTCKQDKKYKGTDLYTFKENDTWLFQRRIKL